MRWRWLLLVVAGLMVSADAPRKGVPYEKPVKEPAGDYLKVEIRGTLEVEESRAKMSAWVYRGRRQDYARDEWVLSLGGSNELQDVVRKLRGKKVVVRGIVTELRHQWASGATRFDLEVTSLRAAEGAK